MPAVLLAIAEEFVAFLRQFEAQLLVSSSRASTFGDIIQRGAANNAVHLNEVAAVCTNTVPRNS